MSRRDKFINALSGISGSMSILFYCTICCKKKVGLKYTKFERDYPATNCCDSLVCADCSEKEGLQKCCVCSKMSKIVIHDKNWLHLDGLDWKRRYALYEAWAKMWGRMPFLGPFTSRMKHGSWLKVLQLHEERGEDQKKLLLAQYLEFEKDFFPMEGAFLHFSVNPLLAF
jgi:hypothetical protein